MTPDRHLVVVDDQELSERVARGITAVDRALLEAALSSIGRFLRGGRPPAWLRLPSSIDNDYQQAA